MTHEHKWQRIINGDGLCECGAKLIEPFEKEPVTPKNSEWDYRFFREFAERFKVNQEPLYEDVKSFIRSLLQERSKEVVAYLADQIKRFGPLERIEIIDSSLHLHHNNPTPYDPERSKDTVGELIEEIGAMKKYKRDGSEPLCDTDRCTAFTAYNSALKDVLQKLSEQLNQK